MIEDQDWNGQRPSHFIGRKTVEPEGVVIYAYIDGVANLLVDIQDSRGHVLYNNVANHVIFAVPSS